MILFLRIFLYLIIFVALVSCSQKEELGPLPLSYFEKVNIRITDEGGTNLLDPANSKCLNLKNLKVFSMIQQKNGEVLLQPVAFNVLSLSWSSFSDTYILSTSFNVSKEKPAIVGKTLFVWSEEKQDTISYSFVNNEMGWHYDIAAVFLNNEKMPVKESILQYYWK